MEFLVDILLIKKLRHKHVIVNIREFIPCNTPLKENMSLGYITIASAMNIVQVDNAKTISPKNICMLKL